MKANRISGIIKLTENCNFICEFCHYSQAKTRTKKIMPIFLCKNIMKQIVIHNKKFQILNNNFIFHGGEPLLVGIDYFEEILNYEKELMNKYNVSINNSVQTNASLINEEWANLFKDFNFSVGISLDGDENLNCHFSTLSNKNLVTSTLEKYHFLRNIGVEVGILSVITQKHLSKSREFYNFLIDNHIEKIGLLPCVNDNSNDTVNAIDLARFYKELFQLYFFGNTILKIREFNIIIEKALGSPIIRNCANCGRASCGNYLTFDSKGEVYFCDFAYDKSKSLGSINHNSIEDIINLEKYKLHYQKAHQFYEKHCNSCKIKHLCGGACYRNDIIQNGKTQNRFCEMYKSFYPYVENIVKTALLIKE